MQINVLEYLERTARRFPQKTAFADDDGALSFSQLQARAQGLGSLLAAELAPRTPVPVLLEKSPGAVAAFLGAVYAGCFYAMADPSLPDRRLAGLFQVLNAPLLVTDAAHAQRARALFPGRVLVLPEDDPPADPALLAARRAQATDADPLYAIFTSGSTGVPKAVVVSHRSTIDFIDAFTGLFGFSHQDVLGNQAPFDFDVSVKDLYTGLATGATVYLIARKYFSMPARLLDLLCRQGVTSLTWAVSALCLVTAMNGLNYKTPDRVRQVLFSGEVMPPKHLRAWRKALPNARFVNLYGPTEITCNCLYYVVDRDFADDEPLPLGAPFPNERVFLLDENNAPVTRPGGLGEICVAGSALALGYYNDPLRTQAVFVQNPLHNAYRDPVYRTGDLARVGDDGQWYYAARRDFQIKHMGHRIELGDIEAALAALDGVDRACCVYLADRRRIAACYAGTAEKADVAAHLRKTLPAFMLPGLYLRLEQLPMNKNGKIDRAALTARLTEKGGGPVDR